MANGKELLTYMKYIVSGKNIEVTEALRDKSIKKLSKLEKFFSPDTDAHITLSVQKNRQIVELTIIFNGSVLRAEVSNEDMYTAIDKAVDIIERQIRRNRTRLEKKLHEEAFIPDNFTIREDIAEEEEFNIVRTKKFAIKPMPVDEAILQMNLLAHTFYMFSNAETNKVNVVYKRKNGDYGLIEPEF
jgi:putative sigma-54 modulation protein